MLTAKPASKGELKLANIRIFKFPVLLVSSPTKSLILNFFHFCKGLVIAKAMSNFPMTDVE